jgi:hypothetical protein
MRDVDKKRVNRADSDRRQVGLFFIGLPFPGAVMTNGAVISAGLAWLDNGDHHRIDKGNLR